MVEVSTRAEPEIGATDEWPARVAAAATLLAVVLVVFDIGDKSLWYDESFSIGIIDRPFGDAMWRLANWEMNQSPFYVLLSGWWRLGHSEVFLRLLPAASTVLAVPAIFALGRRLADARVGAVAALLLAVHPMAIRWGQQLRAYSLVLLLVIVATLLLLRALEHPDDPARAVAYGAVAALATYSHFFAGLVIASHGLWLLLQRPLPRRLIAAAAATYAVLVVPLAWYLLTLQDDPLHWVSDRTGSALKEVARALTGGTRWSVLAYSMAAAVGLLHVWSSWRATPTPASAPTATSPDRPAGPERSAIALPAIWLVAPVLAVTISTATVKPLLEPRFLIVVVPALVLVAAIGVASLQRAGSTALLVGLLLASAWGLHSWYTEPTFEDWRLATRVMVESIGPDDPITVEPRGGIFAIRYYEDSLGAEEHPVLYPAPSDPPAGNSLVEFQSEASVGGPAPLDPGYVAWRDRHYELAEEQQAGKIAVRTYVRR